MTAKKTKEFNTKVIPKINTKRKTKEIETPEVIGVDNNDDFKDSWENLEESFTDLMKEFSKEIKNINKKHELTSRGKEKIEKCYITIKDNIKSNTKLFLEFQEYKNEILKKTTSKKEKAFSRAKKTGKK